MRTVFLYICFGFYVIYTLYLKLKLEIFKTKHDKETVDKYVFDIVSNWARTILSKIGVEVDVNGGENIPDKNCLFVSNHQGDFDPFIMLAYIDKPIGFIAKSELARIPIISMWMKEIHCVFMDRKNIRKCLKAINQGIDNLKRGYSMVVFPEGTISKSHRMLEFKKGSLKLATRSGVLIVPVSIDGSYKIFEENSGRKLVPAHVRLTIEKPIDVNKMSKNQMKSITQIVKKIIEKNLG